VPHLVLAFIDRLYLKKYIRKCPTNLLCYTNANNECYHLSLVLKKNFMNEEVELRIMLVTTLFILFSIGSQNTLTPTNMGLQ